MWPHPTVWAYQLNETIEHKQSRFCSKYANNIYWNMRPVGIVNQYGFNGETKHGKIRHEIPYTSTLAVCRITHRNWFNGCICACLSDFDAWNHATILLSRLSYNKPGQWTRRAQLWKHNFLALSTARRRSSTQGLNVALYSCAANMAEAEVEVSHHLDRTSKIWLTYFVKNLDMITNESCVAQFRFGHVELNKIIPLLCWPPAKVKTNGNQYSFNPTLAKCVVLRRLETSTRWYDLEPLFGKFSAQISEIFSEGLDYFMLGLGHLLTSSIPIEYVQDRAYAFLWAVYEKNMCLENCKAFLTGPS